MNEILEKLKEFNITKNDRISLLEQLVIYLKNNELYEDYIIENFLKSVIKGKFVLNFLLNELEEKEFIDKINYMLLCTVLSYELNIRLLRHSFIKDLRNFNTLRYDKVLNYYFILFGLCNKFIGDISKDKTDNIYFKDFIKGLNVFIKPFIENYSLLIDLSNRDNIPSDKKIILRSVLKTITNNVITMKKLCKDYNINLSNLELRDYEKTYEQMVILKGEE